VTTYRGDIIVGLKFIPGGESSSGSSNSHGLSLRKFSIKSNSSATSSNNNNNGTSGGSPLANSKNTKGSLHVLVKEAKHLSAVKANGHCDAFCKR
jgi:synaptotagmin-like protein